MGKLQAMLDQFMLDYAEATLYGCYSRTLKRKIPAKSQIQAAFIENITMLSKLSDDEKVKKRIENILKSFE